MLLVAWSAAIVPIALGGSGASAGRVPMGGPWKAEGNQAQANFGYSAASAEDVNGDGYRDVIVGAPDYDNGQIAEGRTHTIDRDGRSPLVRPSTPVREN